MTNESKNRQFTKPLLFAGLASALLIGCTAVTSAGSATETNPTQDSKASTPLNGAELWATTCNRCHNFRSPASQTDAHWDVIMMHMRGRANLTGAEYRAIRDYMKSAN